MASPENTSGRISEELFDRFRSSQWPVMFGHMANHSRQQGKPLEDTLGIHETVLIIAPHKDFIMLRDMGIVEATFRRKWDALPTPSYTAFGKQVIAACEGLYTPEEYAAQNEAAKPKLEQQLSEARAGLGMLADQQ
jgi:hypothetical protein